MQLLLAYVSKPRYEGPEIDRNIVEKDAKTLYKAGEKRWGTDEQKFIQIFSESSRAHLAAVAYTYKQSYSNSLEKVHYDYIFNILCFNHNQLRSASWVCR